MSMALTGKNKSGFVDGPITKPTDPTYIAWTCCNTMILSWILHSVSKEIGTIIIFIDSQFSLFMPHINNISMCCIF